MSKEKKLKKEIDWEGVERDYRPNVLSLREIGKKFEVSESMIRKKAAKEGWSRDLAAKIQARAEELVRKEEVRSVVRTESAAHKESEREIVEANATAIVQVKMAHRGDIRRYRNLTNMLMCELEGATDSRELLEQLGKLMEAPDEKGRDALNELYRKVISMPSRIDSVKKLAESLRVLVALEREAYGMDRDVPQKVPAEQLTDAELEDQLQRLMTA